MDELTNRMRVATADAPPTIIDIDHLIDNEHRRSRRVRYGTGLAAIVVAVGVIATLPSVLAGPAGQVRTVTPGSAQAGASQSTGAPTDASGPARNASGPAQDAKAAHLTAQLTPRLTALLPGATLTDPRSAGSPAPWFTGTPELGYDAVVEVRDAAGLATVTFDYLLRRPACTTEPQCETGPECPSVDGDIRCSVRPDGTKVLVMEIREGALRHNQIGIYRPGGAIVQLSASNGDWSAPGGNDKTRPTTGRPDAPLSVDQLIALADALSL